MVAMSPTLVEAYSADSFRACLAENILLEAIVGAELLRLAHECRIKHLFKWATPCEALTCLSTLWAGYFLEKSLLLQALRTEESRAIWTHHNIVEDHVPAHATFPDLLCQAVLFGQAFSRH